MTHKNLISLIVFIFISFVVSCVSAQNEFNLKSLNYNNGIYTVKGEKEPIDGIIYQFKKEKKMIMGKVKNGKKYGLWTELHHHDRRLQETYKNGLLDGFVSLFYANGQKEWRHTYNNGTLNGNYTKWHENGQMAMNGFFEDGVPAGVWLWRDINGKIIKKEIFKKKNKRFYFKC